jgi:hypothetical protein
VNLSPAATRSPLAVQQLVRETAPPDQQKTANDIGEITCLSIPESQVVS